VNLKPGESLIREGMFDQWVYFLVQGDLDIFINDQRFGATAGPVVGERCILGEPRGASLVAGTRGLLALGVEMSIIDAINRDINSFMQQTDDKVEIERYTEARMTIALELLLIILKVVAVRIADIHRSGLSGADTLNRSGEGISVRLKNLFDFDRQSDDDTPASGRPVKQIVTYSFEDFAETVYYELLQKHMTELGFMAFPLEEWQQTFKLGEDGELLITETFEWLKERFGVSADRRVDIALSVFEIASQYTAAANRSFNLILSAFSSEEERQSVAVPLSDRNADERSQIADFIRQELFDPIAEKLKAGERIDTTDSSGKMSQADIDALFG
jgi:hypothetical protein